MDETWISAINALLKLRPFKAFYLVAGTHEWFVERPEMLWIPIENGFAVYAKKDTTDILNLSVLTHLRIDDYFGMVEAKQIWL